MNNQKTAKQQIEEKIRDFKIAIRLTPELHKQFTDLLFEAAYKIDKVYSESEKKGDPVIKQTVDNVERKLVKMALREVGRRLDAGKDKTIQFHIRLEILFNILNMKG